MSDAARPREAADRTAREQREAASAAEMRSNPSPHDRAADALTIAAPDGGYARPEGSS